MIETASGTARTSRKATTAAVAIETPQRAVFGSQVVLDLYDCETDHLDDMAWVKATLINAAREAGATIVDTVFHKFSPWGISGVVVIAESHLAIHIWPENRYAAIDVFTCGQNVRMDVASAFLKREFRAGRAVQRRFARGDRASGKAPAVTNLQPDCKEGRVECR
jgi:S-adenosylmethionine decarboxylase proenzyme